jgi:hypothetical protein
MNPETPHTPLRHLNNLKSAREDARPPFIEQLRHTNLEGERPREPRPIEEVLQKPATTQALLSRGWDIYKEMRKIPHQKPATQPADAGHARQLVAELGNSIMPDLPRPDLLFSMLLVELNRLSAIVPDAAGILFTKNINLAFRPDDFRRYTPDNPQIKGELPSIVERTLKHCYLYAEACANRFNGQAETADEPIKWVLGLIDTYCHHFPDNIWLPYYRAKLLIHAGRRTEAQAGLMQTLRRKSRDFWAWSAMAETYEDPDMRMACLCRALTCPGAKPEFLVKVRTQLARDLFKQGHLPEAKCEIEQVVAIRERCQWNVPPAMLAFRKRTDYQAATGPADNNALYEQYAARTPTILPQQRPRPPAPAQLEAKPGTERNITGTLRLSPAGFAFADNAFISPDLVRAHQLKDGARVSGKALYCQKPKSDQYGWKAVSLHTQ